MKTLYESILSSTNAGKDKIINDKLTVLGLDASKATINPDGSIDYDGNINFAHRPFGKIPFKFNKVNGNFNCSYCQLTTLENAPDVVTEMFVCSNNKLKDLKGGPKEVGKYICTNNQLTSLNGGPHEVKDFSCSYNQLKTLEGGPSEVTNDYYCDENKLKTLAGAPKTIGNNFMCGNNPTLTSLEGGPEVVKGSYICINTKLNNLKGAPKVVGTYFNCNNCGLTTLEGAEGTSVGTYFYCNSNHLTSVIGLPHHIGTRMTIKYNIPHFTSYEDKERINKEAKENSDVKPITF